MMCKLFQKIFCQKNSWAVAVGSTPSFHEIPIPLLPTLSYKDINDRDAVFVADPFLLYFGKQWYCFFEIKDKTINRGVIGVASSSNAQEWHYDGVVLEESYHLSYPYVFSYEGSVYMIPEGGEDKSVKLYKAKNFPFDWECERVLLEGEDFRDTTLFIKKGIFYFFTSQNSDDNLYLYTASSLWDTLQPHPANPLLQNRPDISRNGGNIVEWEGKIYRFAQDCSRRYGEALWMMEITSLSPETFSQKKIKKFLVGDKKHINWHSRKMHHFSSVTTKEQLYFAIDGEGLKKRF